MSAVPAIPAMEGALAWADANQARLLAGLDEVRALLQSHALQAAEEPAVSGTDRLAALTAADEALESARARERQVIACMPAPAAVETLCTAFGLSSFERRLLLLCAGVELAGDMAGLCAAAQGGTQRVWPTFGLALAALPGAHWSALAPSSPLRHWLLVDVLPGDSLAASPLRIDERVLHYLAGISCLDGRLRPLLRRVAAEVELPASQQALAARIAGLWAGSGNDGPAALLCSPDAGARRHVAAVACALMDCPLFALRARDVPAAAPERDQLGRLWERELVLSGSVLLVECDDADDAALRAAAQFVADVRGPVIVSGREPLRLQHRLRIRVDVPEPTHGEREQAWRRGLGDAAVAMNGALDAVLEHFRLGSDAVRAATVQTLAALHAGVDDPAGVLWYACRDQARPRLDDLAQRLEPDAAWDDLVLPPPQQETLRQLAATVSQRTVVHERWGFAQRGRRGLGITALFAGASGTGKTMAAEVLGSELRLDVYRIDLSQVVSKYIGETEKNLGRIFDAAEEGGVVLLFDEADALFGRRSEVKDSHDRYANIEVSYLLQRMEAYRGLAILTTNMRSALDAAFLRRIRFVVQFPFPDAAQRAEIWRRAFPPAAPTDGLRPDRLARLNVPGGNIRNIAVNAAFIAAAAAEPIRMEHLLRATRAEYAKLEKPLTDAEIAGWL